MRVCVFLCVHGCITLVLVCLSILARPRTEQVNSPTRMPLSANRPARKMQVNEKYRFPGEFGERDYSLFFVSSKIFCV